MPDVSLSNLWTGNGFVSLKNSLDASISIKFFFDFVPPWTGTPGLLSITIKSSLFSKILFSWTFKSSEDGENFLFVSLFLLTLTNQRLVNAS